MFLYFLSCATSEDPSPMRFEAFEYLTQANLQKHVAILASDDFEGRGTLEPGLDKAADYIAAEFQRVGLVPFDGESERYKVPFEMFQGGWSDQSTLALVRDKVKSPINPSDWSPFNFSDECDLTAELVFAGFGITAPEYEWDDYADLDVQDKVVLVLRREPDADNPESAFEGTEATAYSTFRSKAQTAVKNGAKGMIVVNDPLGKWDAPDLRESLRLSFEREKASAEAVDNPFCALQMRRSVVDTFIGQDFLTDAQKSLHSKDKRPSDMALPTLNVVLSLTTQKEPKAVELYNVVGRLPATVDTSEPPEWVVVGAHYDHLGIFEGDGDTIYNGADDNASGTSGLLVLAEAYAQKPTRLREMIFVAFTAEEKGLLGSKAFVEQLEVDRVQMMLNLDMIGRNSEDAIKIIGDGYASGLAEAIHMANTRVEIETELAGDEYFGASDHNSFYRKNRPFLFFFTGLHDDYHQVSDHADLLDYGRMEKIIRLGYGTIEPIVEGLYTPGFIHHLPWLGIKLEVQDGRLIVIEVSDFSNAESLGMLINTQVLQVGEATEVDAMQTALSELEVDTPTAIRFQHAGSEQLAEITRPQTGYLGVYPADVSTEDRQKYALSDDEGLLLNQVGEDGPAGQAGLQAGDIVLRFDRQPINNGNLSSTMQRLGAGRTVEVDFLRDGAAMSLSLTLGARPKR